MTPMFEVNREEVPSASPMMTATNRAIVASFIVCPREDSNLNYQIRNLASYPLNDRGDAGILASDLENRKRPSEPQVPLENLHE